MDESVPPQGGSPATAGEAPATARGPRRGRPPYVLENHVGHLLRRAQQRHLSIFAAHMAEGLTAQQFAALAKLHEVGPSSQNSLGRQTGMDNATINGVVARLADRGLVCRDPLPEDRRMLRISLSPEGERCIARALPLAHEITRLTLAPLSRSEQATLLRLLRKIS